MLKKVGRYYDLIFLKIYLSFVILCLYINSYFLSIDIPKGFNVDYEVIGKDECSTLSDSGDKGHLDLEDNLFIQDDPSLPRSPFCEDCVS